MELGLHQIIKELSKNHPNDMDFANKVRQILKEIDGEVEHDLLSKIIGKIEGELDNEKLSPKKEDLEKLENFLNNIKTNQNGVQ